MKQFDLVQSLRTLLLSNLNNKAMALVLALLVWVYAFNNTGDTGNLQLHLNITTKNSTGFVVVSSSIKDSDDGFDLGK